MKFLDDLCSEDDEIVDKVMYNEYWYLPRISCFYPKMNTPKWRALSIFQFILFVSCFVYHLTALAVTAVKLQNNKMEMFQALNYFAVIFMSTYVLMLFNKNRKNLAEVHRGIATGLSNYDEETELLRKTLVPEIQRRKKIFMQLLLSYFSSLPFVLLILERYLNSYLGDHKQLLLSPNLPITVWVPHDTSTISGASTALFLISVLCVMLISVCSTFDFVFLLMCEYLAMEVKLLIHSLNRLPERTLHLFRLRHGDNTNVSIETIKKDKELSNCYRDCLKQNVMHHQNIIRKFHVCKDTLGLVLWLTFAVCAIVIAICGVSIIRSEGKIGSRILSALFAFAGTIICFFFSYCCSKISDASEDLIQALYETKWRSLNKNEVQIIRIMMIRSHRLLLMSFRGMTNFDYDTFASMMNTAYSYLNLLLAFSKDSLSS
ncbi:hypothetical protein O3M35_009072 [Rhynocoris fuscipes]|uniref:Odorant receptor n=1 Tax=Rhynocoris fuscipes TaxID=488301 RepID=A0AAW1D2G1_9HEMI